MTSPRPRVPRWTVPPAALAVVLVWTAGVGFRLGWWHTGDADLAWNGIVATAGGPVGRTVATALAVAGAGLPAVLTAVAVAALVAVRRGLRLGAVALGTCALGALDVALLKAVAGRLRPDASFGLHTSFPSGHTANAAVLACLVAVLLLRGRRRILPFAWPVLMGWSRTDLHAHWLSDVVAGGVLGTATVLLCTAVALPRRLDGVARA